MYFGRKMFVVIFVYLLIITPMVSTTDGNDCEPAGWFGEDCSFRCHCAKFPWCDKYGKCLNHNACDNLYFGPACQYVDLLTFAGSSANKKYLVDHNDSTCNPISTVVAESVALNGDYPLTWFRLVVKYSSKKLDFTVKVNNVKGMCADEHRYWKPNIVDVSCKTTTAMRTLQIVGTIVPFLCSFYINGGRNMALRQQTQQQPATNDSLTIDTNTSAYAVDGWKTNGSCTQLGMHYSNPQWQINYKDIVTLTFILIYFRQSPGLERENITLQTFDDDGNIVSEITNLTPSGGDPLMTTISEEMPVCSLALSRANSSTGSYPLVDICEVETYGDITCPEGYYGLQCASPCLCESNEYCSPVTGRCSEGCQPGFYGTNCSRQCSPSCLDRICDLYSGHCINCIAGYTGETCATECLAGTFGPNCRSKCDAQCTDHCNVTDGRCICPLGFANEWCQGCIAGRYGETCNLTCPRNCKDQICDQITGMCLECLPTMAGPQCMDDELYQYGDILPDNVCSNECNQGHYGNQCLFNCSKNCLSNCDAIHGHCLCFERFQQPYCDECEPGYYGDDCSMHCSSLCENQICEKSSGRCLDCSRTRLGSMCQVKRAAPPWTKLKLFFILLLINVLMIVCCSVYWNNQTRTVTTWRRKQVPERNV